MKITLPATALLAVLLVSTLPHAADAATPRAAFARMRRAVLARAKSMTSLDVRIGKTPEGAIGTWIVLDGELTRLGPNGTFHADQGGKRITVESSTNMPDLASLPPAQREKIEKAIREAMRGGERSSATVKYIVDGKEVDAATGLARLRENGVDLTLTIDLDESDYRSIAFGSDRDHLVLTPRSAKDRRLVVALDPRSGLPRTVAQERKAGPAWKAGPAETIRLR